MEISDIELVDTVDQAPIEIIPKEHDKKEAVGAYLYQIYKYDLLGADEEKRLALHIQENFPDAKKCREKLIKHNLKLVCAVAKKYVNQGLTFVDLIQEGNIGLIHAVNTFSHLKGTKFSTYATWWIRQHIRRALDNTSRTIRLPVHVNELLAKFRKFKYELSLELSRIPTNAEIAPILFKDSLESLDQKITRVKELEQLNNHMLSLDDNIYNQPGQDSTYLTIKDVIEYEEDKSTETKVIENELLEHVQNAINDLPSTVRNVIRFHYGFIDGHTYNREQLAKLFFPDMVLDRAKEKIRQILFRGNRMLKANPVLKDCKELLNI